MAHRTIPIAQEAPAPAPVLEPELQGPAPLLPALLGELDELAGAAFGAGVVRGAWLRTLHLRPGEAELRVAPRLGGCATDFLQAVFELLRARLPDTDIYITVAPQ